jgi:hypothetical protein
MAAPRVFVSSTYYDLQHVRNDIRVFLQGLGYEPIMHDKGNIPYTQEVSLEESCYNELESCDIVICIIGNKFGTKSSNGNYSITMNELQKAIRSRKKIYIYILKDVYIENFTYMANKDNGFIPYHVDNIKIHEFISELKNSIKNHPITPFDNIGDITNNLKQQFAGLFQHLLSQEATITESKTYEDLKDTAESIKNLISSLSIEKDLFFNRFNGSIFAIQPTIRKILTVLGGKQYDIFAPNKDSIKEYLIDLGYSCDDGFPFEDLLFAKINNDYKYTLKLDINLFNSDGSINDIRDRKELENYVTFTSELLQKDDDLPF